MQKPSEWAQRGFTLDLVLADNSIVNAGLLTDFGTRDPLIRYGVARAGGVNVTGQALNVDGGLRV